MGGGASTLPEKLSEDFLRQNFGNKFNENQFNALKNDDGFVDRDLLLLVQRDGAERELFLLWGQFCPQGLMGLTEYLHLLYDTKMLNKQFNRKDSELLFHQFKFRAESAKEHFNYEFFRSELVPSLANIKSLTVFELVALLVRIDGPRGGSLPGTSSTKQRGLGESLLLATTAVANAPKPVTTMSPSPQVQVTENADQATSNIELKAATSEQIHAAEVIQKRTRARIAKREVQQMREVSDCSIFIILFFIRIVHGIIDLSPLLGSRIKKINTNSKNSAPA